MQQLSERKRQLAQAKMALKETYDLKNNLVLEKKKVEDLEVAAEMNKVKYQRTMDQLSRKNESLALEIDRLKNKMDESISSKQEKQAEISRLQEEIKHAGFRVKVLKAEVREGSPKRIRPSEHDDDGGPDDELNHSISELKLKLKMTKKQLNEMENAKDKAEEKLRHVQSNQKYLTLYNSKSSEQSSGIPTLERELKVEIEKLQEKLTMTTREKDELHEEKVQIEQKLFEARSRSRRIAVKSETEMAQMRDVESATKIALEKTERQMHKVKEELEVTRLRHKQECADQKRIESALRKELAILRQENQLSDPKPSLPSSMKNTHFFHLEESLKQLQNGMTNLLITRDTIRSAKNKISKGAIEKLGKEIEEAKSAVTKVEVASAEAFQKNVKKENASVIVS